MSKENKIREVVIKKPESMSVDILLSQAVEKGVPIETLERLLAMRDKMKAEQAKEAFNQAMSNFQGQCPVVVKDKKVMNKDGQSVRYTYAPLDSIVTQVKEILSKNGLSYTTEVIQEEGFVTAICRITHDLGHSEKSSFKIPIDKEGFMSYPQKFASALTFAKRYAFCNALGILTGDDDSDGPEPEKKGVDPIDIEPQKIKLEAVKNLEELKTVWASIPAKFKKELEVVKEELKKKFI